jgi:putative nucleotidyltransferase with HDIG domain
MAIILMKQPSFGPGNVNAFYPLPIIPICRKDCLVVIDLIDSSKAIKQGNLLIVDDDPGVVAILQEMLEESAYHLISAYSLAEARSIIRRQNISIVLTDLMLGDGTGFDLLMDVKHFHPDSQIIIMTGRPTVQDAINAIKEGAYDYLMKPFSIERVRVTVERAAEKIRLEQENIRLKELMSFYQISEAMGSAIKLGALLELILNTSIKEFEADCGTIFLAMEESGPLELRASVGFDGSEFSAMVLEHCREIARQTAEKSTSLIIDDPEIEFDWGEQTIKSSMCQPLLSKGKVLGTIAVVRYNNNHAFTPGQLTGLALLSSKAATAVENSRLYEDLKKTYLSTVEALANAVEARDPYTRGHIERVYLLSRAIAEELGWNEEQLGYLKIGALLHDIGKIGVPDSILNKPGPLTEEESEIMKKHPTIGAKMVESISFLKPALPYILYHHERHDGRGYPLGLVGDDIPVPGRLLAVVDTIDAMTSDRPYRKGKPLAAAMEEIRHYSGTQFNPTVVEACLSAYAKGKLKFLF